jgi:ribosomal protein S18 acetylase RimI-like enzyme
MTDSSTPDIVWRPLAPSDLEDLLTLYRAWEREHEIPYRMSRDELEHELADPAVDLEQDTRVAVHPDRGLVCAIRVMATTRPGFKHRAVLFSLARNPHGPLELDAIRWGEARARERFSGHDDDLERVLRAFAEVTEHERIARYESCGYAIARYFIDMIRPLDLPIPEPAVPGGVVLEPWTEERVDSAHEAHVEAFSDHWGSVPPTLEEFRHWTEAPNFRPDLSWLAIADDRVVGYTMNGVYPEDFDQRGRREGWIDALGTRRRWRRMGLASGLVTRSMQAFIADGLDHAALGVDTASPTGAIGLYAQLGFAESSRSVTLLKEL